MFVRERLKSFPHEQAALTLFKEAASKKNELERVSLATELYDDWIKQDFSKDIFPGVADRNDFWYLFQVFALSFHTSATADFDLSRSVDLLFPLNAEELFSKFIDFSPNISSSQSLNRRVLNKAINTLSADFYEKLRLSSHHHKLRFLRYDELLRSNNPYLDNLDKPILIEGSRQKNSQEYGFIGGQVFLGGKQFIDCWWNDTPLLPFSPLLVIEKLR